LIPEIDLDNVSLYLQKIKQQGKKIVGIFPHSLIPDELIYAAGAFPIKLTLGGDEYATTKGTEYLTQATCPFARGCVGYFDQEIPIYKLIDAYVGGNFCNGDLCGSEMITKFFKIPFLKVTFPTTAAPYSIKFFTNEYRLLKERLEILTGTPITENALREAIDKYNEVRRAFQKLNQTMKSKNPPLLGVDLHNLIHQFFLYGPDEILTIIQNLELDTQGDSKKRVPILVSGTGIALGDEILSVIEEFNSRVVVNDTWSGIHLYHNLINDTGNEDLVATLAKCYLEQCESARMVPNVRRVPRVKKFVQEYKIKGVIDHVLKFCDPYVADYRRFKQAMLDVDIPVLHLERDYATSAEQLKTRIGAFFEMIT